MANPSAAVDSVLTPEKQWQAVGLKVMKDDTNVLNDASLNNWSRENLLYETKPRSPLASICFQFGVSRNLLTELITARSLEMRIPARQRARNH